MDPETQSELMFKLDKKTYKFEIARMKYYEGLAPNTSKYSSHKYLIIMNSSMKFQLTMKPIYQIHS